MPGSGVIDIAIGLVFMYLLLSLIVSAIIELIARVLRLRARFLLLGLQQLLDDPKSEVLTRALYGHPLIKGISPSSSEAALLGRWDKPSYIPSRTFSAALIDVVTRGEPILTLVAFDKILIAAPKEDCEVRALVEAIAAAKRSVDEAALALVAITGGTDEQNKALTALRRALDLAPFPTPETLAALRLAGGDGREKSLDQLHDALYIVATSLTALRALLDGLPESVVYRAALLRVVPAPGALSLERWKRAVGRLHGSRRGREALLSLLTGAERTIEEVQTRIETWFDDSMTRVSGWYKRSSQTITLVVALLITVATCADTLMIAKALSADPTLRASLVASAQKLDGTDEDARLQKILAMRDALPLPIGWSYSLDHDWRDASKTDASKTHFMKPKTEWVFGKFFGLLLTFFAVSLGAPFWFDTLARVVNIRSTGKPPAPAATGKTET